MPARPVIPASANLLAAWRADPHSGDAGHMAQLLAMPQAGLDACLQEQHSPAILDLHFGAGLAFLSSWRRFDRMRAQGGAQRLHYVAIQPHPCTVEQLLALHVGWQELAPYADRLRAAWPLLLPGTHRLLLDDGCVALTLVFGPLDEELARLEAPCDLFYLHGRQQDFDAAASDWNPHACKRLARLAWTGARALVFDGAATAGAMRQVGFAGAPALPPLLPLSLHYAPAWPRPPSHVAAAATPLRRQPEHARHALVIGAGLAGCAIAERLAARGWRIDLVEAGNGPATQASGNHGGLFMPALARDDSPLARLTRAAFLFAGRHWERLGGVGTAADAAIAGERCGILQFGRDARQALSFEQGAQDWNYPPEYARWMDAEQARALLGMPVMGGGYFFPQAGWLNPPSVCRRLLAVAQQGGALATHFGRQAAALRRDDGHWQALDPAGHIIAQAPVVILAAGAQARALAQSASLPLNAVRGQVTHLPAAGFPELPVALCGDGYLTRPYGGSVCMGASYDRDGDTGLRAGSHAENLQRLRNMLPGIDQHYAVPDAQAANLPGRVGFRCIAPDRLPLAGALPDMEAAAALAPTRPEAVPRHAGLYGLLGYASRGLIWAPLMAELLAAMLEREPLPLPRDLLAALDPARFVWKADAGIAGADDC
ncbi:MULTISPECIES: FAD-dependent 5-carboxymethylaminomethyl-2-thiouridine(34) oxidoreductase MnmC [unclassified Herbaspirillum]|uniref:FAD-dependent 5-carboxymethylaminomethyl-2-thiouridine(34) oxidoreductase MnmC n=1 Tax=unclassified Herbaspirillum TaxID=2624150 RepID=UPI00114FFF08|nr:MULTISPECIES: FAD-dependent 5-carboxymethylaminomethyl-2-thiouridine(34) oxidoreductase MnmC [unclassified Herbaspirillum]MBB5393859.1 tRNA 5-methylaminomethyl-2-thiouridine biosynthesis bifunctional protein [Herbaspirillum sp. SJZ102]TQK01287.1 tRNA 5-methylaminomethyl-2-thiouridine biosynthesis bifunctional protein [Herbaspirillum sp. SJZ130]TQK05681.1 tRNA 5-methylaminomethyl-2-thiouridine biosynthesis bifunctional protein [Herbaspirillum sp. SJZ106]